jgi:hypothetical protein
MNVGFLGDVQNLNASPIYGSSGVSATETSAEFDDCEVTVGSGVTTFRVGLPASRRSPGPVLIGARRPAVLRLA